MRAKHITQALVLAVVFASTLAHAQQPTPPTVIGNAYDRDTGHFLYSEHHFCAADQMLCTVQYRDNLGEIFATKDLDYRQNPISPSLTMTDYRRDMQLRIPASEQSNVVVDAGFDNYVRSIWEDLDAGNKATFPFLVAGFDKPVKMKALRNDSNDCTSAELCLEINLDSWFLGMIIDPIELSYSRADRKLRRFSGISNIKDEDGDSLNVDIHYQYDEELLLAHRQGLQTKAEFSF
jgi:hypothetical protein